MNAILSNWTAAPAELMTAIAAELEYEDTCDCAGDYGYDDEETEEEDEEA